uniref:Uncharacterized protein n=1 Tax=Arundo donax TaxID=35708 RepID=A0A0A9B8R3_ARUDO
MVGLVCLTSYRVVVVLWLCMFYEVHHSSLG